jgi:uncharacterized protein GlcG (DUF336 family)
MMAVAQLSKAEVKALLDRASAATPSNDAIIAVVDRTGKILGVRTEAGVVTSDRGFAIDGAVAKARTGAFFSNGQAILTSRTVSHISQSTVTQREMQANPASVDPLFNGPGYVAPVGIGGEFPPGILRQPLVDLFAIEHTNRTSVVVGGNVVTNRASYAAQLGDCDGAVGSQEGQPPQPLARGIATMPGGVGIYRALPKTAPDEDKLNALIGGIGVFFPGSDGTASFEQGFVASANQTRADRLNAQKALEAETIALVTLLPIAIPGTKTPLVFPANPPTPDPRPEVANPLLTITLAPPSILEMRGVLPITYAPFPAPLSEQQAQALVNRVNAAARINLGGVALQSFGPNAGPLGVRTLFNIFDPEHTGMVNGTVEPVEPGKDYLKGTQQPDGWLVPPTAGTSLTAAQVEQIVMQGIAQAAKTRAQIRVQPTFTKMVFAVADTDGSVLGVYRMPDATVFSIDVAIAKARNTAYYASASLQPQDRIVGVPLGTAFTNRTFRYLAVPKYPSGNASAPPGPFSILATPGIDPRTGLNVGGPLSAAAMSTTVLGRDSFVTGSNFRATTPAANQNGIVFFPGSTAAYVGGNLAGGFGVSGDGVDQDDVVTAFGIAGYAAPTAIRADQHFVRGIRLPYIKFSRNAEAGARR